MKPASTGWPVKYKSVFKYYGGKFNQLQDIIPILEDHLDRFDIIVDLFGGSGKVLLNIPDEWKKLKVYNDLNKDLYHTFKVLQDPRKRMALQRKLRASFLHSDISYELRDSTPGNDVEVAFKTIYLHNNSFLADGRSFGRRFTKSRISRYTVENFILVKNWVVENKDFRDLMAIYNKPRVLIYLDPPYASSGKKYRYNFNEDNFRDLKLFLDNHVGSYLMNLSLFDESAEGIFGPADKVIDYANPAVEHGEKKWGCGYWWRFGPLNRAYGHK